ncbi:hypothetical protein DJ93_4520 [Bacillus clarus]|uniref:Uncharacterized protein n=2 Tax=Bacillus clarus TaxID=2338372 RepID=A0A090YW38_9BACI|nr:hypothetical protein DJ93_4520 [Bacillus clarus]
MSNIRRENNHETFTNRNSMEDIKTGGLFGFKADAAYTAHKYEVLFEKIDIPDIIPYFRDHDITLRLELGVGNLGFKVHAGAENGIYTPLYKDFAAGLFVKPEKKE